MGKNPFYFSSAEFHSKYFGLLWVKVDILKRQAGIYGVWHVHGGAARLLGAARRHQWGAFGREAFEAPSLKAKQSQR